MTFIQSIKTCFSKCFTVSCRASRSEYWWFVLFSVLLDLLTLFLDTFFDTWLIFNPDKPENSIGVMGTLAFFICFVPCFTLQIRRLHDINRSGWWQLIALIPLIGFLIILYWNLKAGTKGPNQYGQDPLNPEEGG